jgi:hypothetical protein
MWLAQVYEKSTTVCSDTHSADVRLQVGANVGAGLASPYLIVECWSTEAEGVAWHAIGACLAKPSAATVGVQVEVQQSPEAVSSHVVVEK